MPGPTAQLLSPLALSNLEAHYLLHSLLCQRDRPRPKPHLFLHNIITSRPEPAFITPGPAPDLMLKGLLGAKVVAPGSGHAYYLEGLRPATRSTQCLRAKLWLLPCSSWLAPAQAVAIAMQLLA
ncbi:hypothetical protein ACFX14_022304 [Malus domestica]